MSEKICPRCKTRPRLVSKKGRTHPYCSACGSEIARNWAKKNPKKVKETSNRYYQKDIEKSRAKCREKGREWYFHNKEKAKKYAQDSLEKRRIRDRKRRVENRDKIRAAARKWYRANPGYAINNSHKRRLLARNSEAKGEFISIMVLCEKDEWICRICGNPVEKNKIKDRKEGPSIDHIVPLSKGGSHTWKNVQLAHRSCNFSKRSKVLKQKTLFEMPTK